MTLDVAIKGKEYEVKAVNLEQTIKCRLEALGLTTGTRLKVLNRNLNGAIIFWVRGSRLAVGRHIASSIQIIGG